MQQDDSKMLQATRIRPARLIKHPHQFLTTDKWKAYEKPRTVDTEDVAAQPTRTLQPAQSFFLPDTPQPGFDEDEDLEFPNDIFDISSASTTRLMQLSGMMRAIQVKRHTGAVPAVNFYMQPQAQAVPYIPLSPAEPPLVTPAKSQARWKAIIGSPTARIVISLVIGIILLGLTVRAINIQETFATIAKYLLTPLGLAYALLAGLAFVASFSVRGLRWKLFLNPIGKVSYTRAIQLFWIGVFINFLLPVRGGELAKSLMLKRISNIPVSQSLPTVAMDKALDLMPALVIMAIVPLLPGVHMTPQLWFVLIVVSGVLVGLIFFIALAAWKRTAAIQLMKTFTRILPRKIGGGIEGFATGFVDSLLAGASQPKVFVPAMLLTIVAVFFDGLFAMLAFWAVGLYMPFGMAIFGYTVYNMFCILPNAPAGVGTNEATGAIVFVGLLNYNSSSIEAMFAFSHPWTTIIMVVITMVSLSSLGLTFSNALKMRVSEDEKMVQRHEQVSPTPLGV